MDLKFTLSPQQVAEIQRASQQRFEAADKAMRAAREEYNKSLTLSSTRQYTVSELTDILAAFSAPGVAVAQPVAEIKQPEQDDFLPRNILVRYRFGSKSGEGAGHEVTLGYDTYSSQTRTSCNCEAGRFRRDCWAQKAVKQHFASYGRYSNSVIGTKPEGTQVHFAPARFGQPK